MTQIKARDSQRQVQYLSFTHNDVIRASDVNNARQVVDARERDEIVCLGEILMQVKQNQKIIYRSIYM